jgi:hypothetical protein
MEQASWHITLREQIIQLECEIEKLKHEVSLKKI